MSKWSAGTSFHSLQATSQALQPMQMLVSVKKPLRFGWSVVVPGVGRGVQRSAQVELVEQARHGVFPSLLSSLPVVVSLSTSLTGPHRSTGSRCRLTSEAGPVVTIGLPGSSYTPARRW